MKHTLALLSGAAMRPAASSAWMAASLPVTKQAQTGARVAVTSSSEGRTLGALGTRILTGHLGVDGLPMALQRAANPHKTLFQLLSTLPNDGVGARVRQRRWEGKGIDVERGVDLHQHVANTKYLREQRRLAVQALREATPAQTALPPHPHPTHSLSYWTVTKVTLTDGGTNGEAWGTLTWRGRTEPALRRIRGCRKHFWDLAR